MNTIVIGTINQLVTLELCEPQLSYRLGAPLCRANNPITLTSEPQLLPISQLLRPQNENRSNTKPCFRLGGN